MRKYNICTKLVRTMEQLSDKATSTVQMNGSIGEWFRTTVGVWGCSGGAMVLGKLPVPGRPTNLDWSRARAYCACSRCGRGLFGHFFSRLSFLYFFSLSLGDGPI